MARCLRVQRKGMRRVRWFGRGICSRPVRYQPDALPSTVCHEGEPIWTYLMLFGPALDGGT